MPPNFSNSSSSCFGQRLLRPSLISPQNPLHGALDAKARNCLLPEKDILSKIAATGNNIWGKNNHSSYYQNMAPKLYIIHRNSIAHMSSYIGHILFLLSSCFPSRFLESRTKNTREGPGGGLK